MPAWSEAHNRAPCGCPRERYSLGHIRPPRVQSLIDRARHALTRRAPVRSLQAGMQRAPARRL